MESWATPQVGGEDRANTADVMRLEQELAGLEQWLDRRPMRWPWLLVIAGLVLVVGLGAHGYGAYSTIVRIDANSRIDTPNPVVVFQDVATNGPRVGSAVETSSRAAYSRSLEQLVLDGTGVALGLVLVLAGGFIRVNG
jgi:hypothetical protein